MPFTVDGRKLTETDMDDDFAMAAYAPASITGWQGAKYTRTTAADADASTPEMTDTVVRYTDQADPTDQAYSSVLLRQRQLHGRGAWGCVSATNQDVVDTGNDDLVYH